jgi:hypothetical protein
VTTRWTGRCDSTGFRVLGLGLGLVLLGIGLALLLTFRGAGVPSWVGWLLVVVAVVLAVSGWWLSSVEVRVEDDAFVVAFGPFRRPRRVIPLADIREVAAGQVDPLQWGGWGYRWIPWQNASAAVIRKGPGIMLALADDRRFAVTVDDARDGALALGHALEDAKRRH